MKLRREDRWVPCCMLAVMGRKPLFLYLLSDDVGIMTCLDFEGAIVRPEIYGVGNTSNATFIDLIFISGVSFTAYSAKLYQFSCLCTCNRKFQIGILFPVTEKQWKFSKESIVYIPGCDNGLRVRVSIQSAFQRLCSPNELLPVLEIVWVFCLWACVKVILQRLFSTLRFSTYHFGIELLQLSVLFVTSAKTVIGHDRKLRLVRVSSLELSNMQ